VVNIEILALQTARNRLWV